MARCRHDVKLWEPVDPNEVDEIGFANHWRCTVCGEVRSAPSAERKAQIRRSQGVFFYSILSMVGVVVIVVIAVIAYIVWRRL